jgi:saccharopine dehydrogenase (NAD+, L-lysine-forming)
VRVALLGAGGTIAPAIARDLSESDEIESLALFDLDGTRARAVAEAHGGEGALATAVDARDPAALALALDGIHLLVNAASFHVNLPAMDACLIAGCGYIDLGGLYHGTTKQLARSDEFAEKGLLAILGAGAGPGKTNVMALAGARELDDVEVVRTSSSGRDLDPPAGFSTPYAVATLIDELTVPPVVVRNGEPIELEPLADGGTIPFPQPIGEASSIYTLHSEVRTLPDSLGARECDFRLSLSPAVLEGLLALRDRPREEIAAMRPAPPSAKTYSAQHVEVRGTRNGASASVTVTALTVPHEEWGLGGGIVSTASVAAAAARLYARGRIQKVGALPPESCIEPHDLFTEIATRGCVVEIDRSEGAGGLAAHTETETEITR